MSAPEFRLPLRVHPIPLDLLWQDPAGNWEQMKSEILTSLKGLPLERDPGEDLFVFPELTLTGFTTQDPLRFALASNHPLHEEIRAFARSHRISILYGFPEKSPDGGVRNILSVIGDDGIELAHYAKIHLFTHGAPAEVETYFPGSTPATFALRGWKIGLGICFDLRFPELFRSYAKDACDLMILSACWLGGPTKSDQFKTLARAQAILTQSYFVALNRSGVDPSASYEGEALVYGPRGEVLLETSSGRPTVRLTGEHLEPARRLPILASLRTHY